MKPNLDSLIKFVTLPYLCFFLVACQSMRPAGEVTQIDSNKVARVEPEARSLFLQAERAFMARKYEEAVERFTLVKQRFPKGKAAMFASYRLGTVYYIRQQYTASSNEFGAFLSKYPNTDLAFDVSYNLAASQYQLGEYDKAKSTLQHLDAGEVRTQADARAELVYQLEGLVAAATNDTSGEIVSLSNQLSLNPPENRRQQLEQKIESRLAFFKDKAQLEQLSNQVREASTLSRIQLRLSDLTVENLSGTPETGSENPNREQAALPGLGSATSGDKMNVGVILPLSGKSAAYGRKAQEGILLAASVYSRSTESEVKVFFEDSASNPSVARQATDELYHTHNVMAVIGPLGWKESVAVAERCQELGVMNLSLTGKEGLSQKGAYLFQNALTARVQLESLVRYSVQEKQFRRFAIIAPDNSFGRDMGNEFWNLVENYGGKVVGYKDYPENAKDFQGIIRSLVGLEDLKFRRMESQKMADFIKERKEKTGKEPKNVRLPAIVDFDAIFIPDSPAIVAQVAASLAYFSAAGATLLGTTEWNSDQLYKRGGRYVEGAVFPGGLSLNSRNTKQRDFIRQYSESFRAAPDLLSTQAYEAMDLIAAIQRRSRSGNRNSLVNEMASLRDYESPLGRVSFDSTRVAKRVTPVFTLLPGGAIVER